MTLGERLVAWQWMGLLAEWIGVWPVLEGGDWPITTFPTILGFPGLTPDFLLTYP